MGTDHCMRLCLPMGPQRQGGYPLCEKATRDKIVFCGFLHGFLVKNALRWIRLTNRGGGKTRGVVGLYPALRRWKPLYRHRPECGPARAVHNRGQGAKYTRSRLPVTVVWRESQPNKSAALRREAAIKRLHREEKLALIHGTVPLDIIQESEAQIL